MGPPTAEVGGCRGGLRGIVGAHGSFLSRLKMAFKAGGLGPFCTQLVPLTVGTVNNYIPPILGHGGHLYRRALLGGFE